MLKPCLAGSMLQEMSRDVIRLDEMMVDFMRCLETMS